MRVEHLADLLLDHLERALDGDGHHVDVAVVGDPQPLEGRDPLGMTVGADHRGLGPDLAGTEAGARAVRGPTVEGNAEERHLEGTEVAAVGQPHERGDLAEARRDEGVRRVEIAHLLPLPQRRFRARGTILALPPLSIHSRFTIWTIQSVIRAYTLSPCS